MKLTEADIKAYQNIYFEIYKNNISQDVAYEELLALVSLINHLKVYGKNF
jgi:hypothetical protein